MNNILWYQPAILSEKDVIIYNGNPLEEGLGRSLQQIKNDIREGYRKRTSLAW